MSDDSDEILRLQGVSWFIRKAIATATVYLSIRHYKDQNGVDHIDIDESLSGVPGTKDLRTLDWSEKRQKDFVFGPVVMQSKRVNPEDIELDFLRNGWLDDANEHGIIFMKDMNEPSKSGKTWTIYQVSCYHAKSRMILIVFLLEILGVGLWRRERRAEIHQTRSFRWTKRGEASEQTCLRLQ